MKINHILDISIDAKNPFLIVEAGVNHEGCLHTAFDMIDAAADAGADMIKFQSYKAETLASKHSPAYWDQTKEAADSQYELFKKHDTFGDEEYEKLAKRCEQKGILFSSTPFDQHFVDQLDPWMPLYKIASADLTNHILLKQIAKKKKPVLLSTGASTLEEIKEAYALLKDQEVKELGLLHCVLEYPTRPEHSNLRSIKVLQETFPDVSIGWSDHVPPDQNCTSLLLAWLLGATILEKHYTLDKTLPGNDHYHAMDPDDIIAFKKQVSWYNQMLGEEMKEVLPWEQAARTNARRSLVAREPISQGTVITENMLIPKRPGTGISPRDIGQILGLKAAIDIPEDTLLERAMLE